MILKMISGVFATLAFLMTASFVHADSGVYNEYKQALDAANAKLSALLATSTASSCPSVELALSCGNGTCEPNLGENEETCPTDCLPVLVRSYNSQTFCKDIKELLIPETDEAVQDIVKKAASTGTHVRVVSTKHSSNRQLCTDGVAISMEKFNHVLGIEQFEGTETVLVEPGASIREVTEWLHLHDRSIGYGLVGFKGITVGGISGTAAHGSSPRHSAILATAVKSVKVVTADGSLREFSEGTTSPETFRALRAHLGLLGVVVQMRIQIRPQFNLDTRVTFESEKKILGGNNAVDLIRGCDFGQLHWFPSAKKVVKTCGQEDTKPADPGATNVYLDPWIPELIIKPYKLAFHYGACDSDFNALFEKLRFFVNRLMPPMKKQNLFGHLTFSDHVTGPSHRMLSSELGLGKETLVVRDWEVAIPESQVPAAMIAIDEYLEKNKIALPITGVYLRVTPVEEQTLLSSATVGAGFKKGELAVYIEFPSYYPIGFEPARREEYANQYAEIFKILIEKFQGRAHLGKNQDSIFAHQKKVGNFKENLDRFRAVVQELDPRGVFSNSFSRELLEP